MTSYTQITYFEKNDIYKINDDTLEYELLIELSVSENIIAETGKLVAQGENLKPTTNNKYYTVRNTIFSEFPTMSEFNTYNNTGIIVPKGYILYL